MSTKTEVEEYEDINIKENNIENNLNIDKRESEMNDLQIIIKQLSKDYSNYFDINTNLEVINSQSFDSFSIKPFFSEERNR
jgi:hypothetical protein